MITRRNEFKTLTKHNTCNCKCKFMVENVIQIKSGTKNCIDMSVKIQ